MTLGLLAGFAFCFADATCHFELCKCVQKCADLSNQAPNMDSDCGLWDIGLPCKLLLGRSGLAAGAPFRKRFLRATLQNRAPTTEVSSTLGLRAGTFCAALQREPCFTGKQGSQNGGGLFPSALPCSHLREMQPGSGSPVSEEIFACKTGKQGSQNGGSLFPSALPCSHLRRCNLAAGALFRKRFLHAKFQNRAPTTHAGLCHFGLAHKASLWTGKPASPILDEILAHKARKPDSQNGGLCDSGFARRLLLWRKNLAGIVQAQTVWCRGRVCSQRKRSMGSNPLYVNPLTETQRLSRRTLAEPVPLLLWACAQASPDRQPDSSNHGSQVSDELRVCLPLL